MSDQEEPQVQNDQLILISGESASGKSASLRKIKEQENWLYLCTEAGKKLPFRNKFRVFNIDDPLQVIEAFEYAAANPEEIKGIIIDTLTFLMDMYESMYVIGSNNTQKAWGDYAQFFKNLMQVHVNKAKIPVIILAHTRTEIEEGDLKTCVPVKGSLKNNGIEALEISALVE